jgi:hypothetical protein
MIQLELPIPVSLNCSSKIMVAALIDRVTFRAHILDMNVKESYRLEETLLKRKKNSDR